MRNWLCDRKRVGRRQVKCICVHKDNRDVGRSEATPEEMTKIKKKIGVERREGSPEGISIHPSMQISSGVMVVNAMNSLSMYREIKAVSKGKQSTVVLHLTVP